MKGLALLAAAICLCGMAVEPYQKGKAKGDVQILEAKGRRSEDQVVVDGRIRVTSDKPIKGLVLAFDFLSDDGDVLTTEKDQYSEDVLKNGDELPFHVETMNPPGSIRYKIRAFDTVERELRVIADGPYIIY
jgi:hypothetical protein